MQGDRLYSESTAHRTPPHTTKSDITKAHTTGPEMDTGRFPNGAPHTILNLPV